MEAQMTAITYDTAAAPAINQAPTQAAKGKPQQPKAPGLFRLIYEGMLEGRRLQAEMMVKHHFLTWY
jgi:hypothetical protein